MSNQSTENDYTGSLRVLVACEYSGTVRDAFIRAGHDAMSCDLLPSESDLGPHHQGDVMDLLGDGWDLMVAHPPCTYLTKAGVRWLYEDSATGTSTDRWKAMVDAAVLFRELLNAPIPRVAVENPQMHGFATKIIGAKATQYVQPWMFGHAERKGTGLWLRGLPPLIPTEDVYAETMALPAKLRDRIHYAAPGADRWKVRSTFYPGIADAMALQWGGQVDAEVAA